MLKQVMRYVVTGLRYGLALVLVAAMLLTLVSVVPSAVWWVQALGFPRLQALVVLAVAIAGLALLGWPAHRRLRAGLLLGGGLALAGQAWFLVPYLPFAPRPVPDAPAADLARPATRLRVLVVNVLISNRQAGRVRQVVQAARPDVLLALEPDRWWAQALRPLHAAYPYRVELPRADAYGMLLFSRLPLTHTQVMDLVQPGVPAIRTRLRLPDGRALMLLAIHPTPPIPDNYPDGVGLRGQALRQVAEQARRDTLPTLVAGDFNDVSWSGTIHQLTRSGTLRDVSRGRGLFNTFDATSPVLRWPLDHFFVSRPFQVAALRRLPAVGSDHFPLYAELVLPPKPAAGTPPRPASAPGERLP